MAPHSVRIFGKHLLLHNKHETRAGAPGEKEGSFSQLLWAFEEAIANALDERTTQQYGSAL